MVSAPFPPTRGASCLQPPLLGPRTPLYAEMGSVAQYMGRGGTIVSLPHDLRVTLFVLCISEDANYIGRSVTVSLLLGALGSLCVTPRYHLLEEVSELLIKVCVV